MKKSTSAHKIFLLIIVLQIALRVVLSAFEIHLTAILSILLSQSVLLIPIILYCVVTRTNLFELIRVKKISFVTVLLSILVGFLSLPVVTCLNMLSMLFVKNATSDMISETMPLGFVMGVVLLAVLPAIVEETTFRGLLYNTYSKQKPLAGVFLSAFIFGLMHMNFNQMPYAMFLGIVMALLMEACDSIIAPMLLHFTINATSTVTTFLTSGLSEIPPTTGQTDFKSTLIESYRMSFEETGVAFSVSTIENMATFMMVFTILIYVIAALSALAAVMALIYGIFKLNNRKPSEIFKKPSSYLSADNEESVIERKSKLVDIYVILIIIYAFVQCVMSV